MCIRREVFEETGLASMNVGSVIWRHTSRFVWRNQTYHQEEEFYLFHTDKFEASGAANTSELEATEFVRFKWWTSQEIKMSDDVFYPHKVAELLDTLIRNGLPDKPIEVIS